MEWKKKFITIEKKGNWRELQNLEAQRGAFFIAKKRGKQIRNALHEGIHNCVMVFVENYMKCDMDNLYIFCV